MKKMKIGVFGGSFNPVHKGHIFIAKTAMKRIGLDRIIFVPANVPPHIRMKKLASGAHRLKMLKLAVMDFHGFTVSGIELKRRGMSYTIDTIRYFKRLFGTGNEFYFICGTDNITELPFWKESASLMKECQFVFYKRGNAGKNAIDRLKQFAGPGAIKSLQKHFLDGVMVNISATDIRERIRRGESPAQLVPEIVLKYIEKNSLYE